MDKVIGFTATQGQYVPDSERAQSPLFKHQNIAYSSPHNKFLCFIISSSQYTLSRNFQTLIKTPALPSLLPRQDMQSYGSGHGSGHHQPYCGDRRIEVVSGRSHGWSGSRSPDSAQGSEKPWRFSDPEAKRKKRIAKYKVYGVEGKVKATLKEGLRWIKKKCSQIAHGY
ncbi:hypothetical protein VNO80_04482 [Phaseolus coccineus]|uniref:DUF3511 domain protein n=1 Tax=Phaseolus coccineus TaxID=3886 RepID=A0AAN9NUZ6_PHACN